MEELQKLKHNNPEDTTWLTRQRQKVKVLMFIPGVTSQKASHCLPVLRADAMHIIPRPLCALGEIQDISKHCPQ